MSSSPIRRFLFPALSKKFFLRIILLGLVCYVIFGHLLLPLRIKGQSMEPTYRDGGIAFCWRLQYLFSTPEHADVVTVRFSGRRVMLLKRIVALPGETVEFRTGFLYIDGKMVEEPYVRNRSGWDLPPRKIAPEHMYVVGDNRGTPMDLHKFGEIHINRIVGGVIP